MMFKPSSFLFLRRTPQKNAGFSLLEIMIALAILSFSLMALYQWIAVGVRGTRTTQKTTVAVQLARSKMTDLLLSIEQEMSRGAFPDEKEEKGVFDKPFDFYRWSYTIRKVALPVVNISQEQIEAATPSGMASGAVGATLMQSVQNVLPVIMKKISESTREVQLNIEWGEGDEVEDRFVLTTHLTQLR